MMVYLVSPNERKMLTNAGDRKPLSVLYLSSALTAGGVDNEVFDLNHTPWLNFIDRVKRDKPDAVGLSVISTPAFPQMRRLAQEIRPYTGRIVMGGFHASALPHTLEDVADTVVVGDGETAILRAVNGEDGIISGDVNVNDVPIPDRSKLSGNEYGMHLLGLKISGVTTARGCPYSCDFCGNMNKTVKFRDPGNIRTEIAGLKKDGVEAVYFYNESHTLNKGHAEAVGRIMKDAKMKYRLETRANLVDGDMARMLSDTGCMMVALGIESGDDKVLEAIHKGETTDHIRAAVYHLARHGIPMKGYFIMGLPEQDLASGLRSIDFAKELKTKGMIQADFYNLTPFPGSPIAKFPEQYGVRVLSDNPRKYLEAGRGVQEPVIETDWLSKEGIKSLVTRARLEWDSAPSRTMAA